LNAAGKLNACRLLLDEEAITMAMTMSKRRFPMGRMVITPNALRSLEPADVWESLKRHANGDWGDVCDTDRDLNDEALFCEARILSRYVDRSGVCFWIITEWDRSQTTILLPADY